MDRKIKQVHFQITRNCNLRCPFCGQWGKKGFFADSSGIEMTREDWNNVIIQLEKYREKTGANILITVWGGEPLISPIFDELMRMIHEKGFKTEVITNGVLIAEHKEILETYADRVYVSLDGTAEVHNEIRGNGVFEKVANNLKKLQHNNITIMSVVTKNLMCVLPVFLTELQKFNIKSLYLQDMIGLTTDEINHYKAWAKSVFGIDATEIDAWENNGEINFADEIDSIIDHTPDLNYTIEHKAHSNRTDIHCMSPFWHMHITWNGDVTYCTDFYDFKAGNVKEDTVETIFFNEKSEIYRNEITSGNCITCMHCSWKCASFEDE